MTEGVSVKEEQLEQEIHVLTDDEWEPMDDFQNHNDECGRCLGMSRA